MKYNYNVWLCALTLIVSLSALASCAQKSSSTIDVGYELSPLLGHLFVYEENYKKSSDEVRLSRFASSSDVAYNLLAGTIQAGFVNPEKALLLKNLPGFEKISVVGKVEFPFGATVVVQSGSPLRLSDLHGKKLGVSSPHDKLLIAFKEDVIRFGVDEQLINYVWIPYDSMIPALEAGTVDAVLLKGAYSAMAQSAGHDVLYQRWDVEAGDECCPPVIAQLEFLLLVRNDSPNAIRFAHVLGSELKILPEKYRAVTAKKTNISASVLAELPMPFYESADNLLLELFGEHFEEEDHEDEDEDEDEGGRS